MIKKSGNKWIVLTSDGKKRLGTHDTEDKAKDQLIAIEISKRAKHGKKR